MLAYNADGGFISCVTSLAPASYSYFDFCFSKFNREESEYVSNFEIFVICTILVLSKCSANFMGKVRNDW